MNLAEQNLAQQGGLPALAALPTVTVSPDERRITVQLTANVHLTLLGLAVGNHPIHIVATGGVVPRQSGT